MLSSSDLDLVRTRGYCFHHAVNLMAIVEGEPFLRDGFLMYWDGRRMLLSGDSLVDNAKDAESRTRAIVHWCLNEWPVEVMWYVGRQRISLGGLCPKGFRHLRTIPPGPLDCEFVIDCRREAPSERLRRWLCSDRKSAFEIRHTRTLRLTAAHYRLLDHFFSSRERTEFLLNLALQVTVFAANGAGEWLEAWHANRLAGIALIIDSFSDMDLAVFASSDRGVPWVGDVLHAAMIETVRKKGKSTLNLGSSPSEYHARFKRKWGGCPRESPSWWQVWGRGELATHDYDGWPARLFGRDR
jgi:hypothetical protein